MCSTSKASYYDVTHSYSYVQQHCQLSIVVALASPNYICSINNLLWGMYSFYIFVSVEFCTWMHLSHMCTRKGIVFRYKSMLVRLIEHTVIPYHGGKFQNWLMVLSKYFSSMCCTDSMQRCIVNLKCTCASNSIVAMRFPTRWLRECCLHMYHIHRKVQDASIHVSMRQAIYSSLGKVFGG